MALKFTNSYLEDSLSLFHYYKKLAERAMEQVTDEQLSVMPRISFAVWENGWTTLFTALAPLQDADLKSPAKTSDQGFMKLKDFLQREIAAHWARR
ncbi:MAG: DUF1572 domain-containing protein [Acidobacteriota bacterium]|nr:DUF1572 domain-containing protein [Acidobacteriota bacterium]